MLRDSALRVASALPWLALLLASWTACGLLLVRRVFRLRDGVEVAALALPVGLLAQLLLVNGLSYAVPPALAIWVVCLAGLLGSAAYLARARQEPLGWELSPATRAALLALLVAAGCGALLLGLREVFPDDGAHGTMTRLLAAGEFPLRFPCNPALRLSYHYGGDLLAASVLVVGGLPVWETLDVVRAVVLVCVLLLAFLAGWRPQRSVLGGLASAGLVATVGQMRWLDAALVDSGIAGQWAGHPPLGAWVADVRQILEFPLGIGQPGTAPPLVHAHRSLAWGFGPLQILLTLALLEGQLPRAVKGIAVGVAIGLTSLVQVAAWVVLLPTVLLAWVLGRFRATQAGSPGDFALAPVAILALALALVQGGPLTDTLADRLDGTPNATTGFELELLRLPACRDRSPSLACALRSVSDAGLAPWLLAWPAWLAWRRRQHARLALAGGCLAGLLAPLTLRYAYIDDNIVRTLTFSIWSAGALLGPPLADWLRGRWLRRLGALALLAGLGACGLAFLVRLERDPLFARLTPGLFKLGPHDAALSPLAARVPLAASIFDPAGCALAAGCGGASRPGLILGRYVVASADRLSCGRPAVAFATLRTQPTAELLRASGYTHVYADARWLSGLAEHARQQFLRGPLELMGAGGTGEHWRALLRVCGPQEPCALDGQALHGWRPDAPR